MCLLGVERYLGWGSGSLELAREILGCIGRFRED